MSEISRREALVLAGACACCSLLADGALAADHDRNNHPTGLMPKSLEIGKLADYPHPGFYDKFSKQRVMICRLDDRLVAMSAVCTHKGCIVRIQPDDKTSLKCPCHKAVFTEQGTVDSGPARSSLVRYALKSNANGTITADLTKSFDEKHWDDPAAFIALKPAT